MLCFHRLSRLHWLRKAVLALYSKRTVIGFVKRKPAQLTGEPGSMR